jgi:hypothetical protein
MEGLNQKVKVAPSFGHAFSFFFKLFVTVFIVLDTAYLIGGKTSEEIISNLLPQNAAMSLLFLGSLIVLGVTFLAVFRHTIAIEITKEQISGRTENGRRVMFPTDSISDIEFHPNPYVPVLLISSTQSADKLVTVLIGVDFPKTTEELKASIGLFHPLTRWFDENAA